jgi:hypothetical protein
VEAIDDPPETESPFKKHGALQPCARSAERLPICYFPVEILSERGKPVTPAGGKSLIVAARRGKVITF